MIDLRLAAGTVAAWLALLTVGQQNAPVVAASAGVVLVVAAVSAALRPSWAPPVAATSACVLLVLGPLTVRDALDAHSPLAMLAARHATVTLRIRLTEDPRQLAATGMSGVARVAVTGQASALVVAGEPRAVDGQVLVLGPASGWRELLPGQPVDVTGQVQPSLDGPSAGVTVFTTSPPFEVGRPPWWQAAAGTVRADLQRAAAGLPQPERGLLPGLVDGDTSGLDPVLADRFRTAGLSHLVAVSGSNCSIVVGAVALVLARSRLGPRWRAVIAGVVLLAFVVVARPSPSVLRAAVMAGVALSAGISGRPARALPMLALTTLVLLAWQPALASDAGFAMSVLATAALLVLAPGWAATLRRHRVPAGLAEAVAVAAAAHAVTAPVVAALRGTVSLVAIPANVLAEPAVAPATMLGFSTAVLAPFWPFGGAALATLAGWPCRWLVFIADRAGAIPAAAFPWPAGVAGALTLAAATVGMWLAFRRRGVGRLLVAAVVVVAVVRIPASVISTGWPPAGWDLVACDVGQGDGLVLPAAPHVAVVVDTGPAPTPIDRCLRGLGVRTVRLLLLTHFHLDHVGGILGVLHDRTVGAVMVGPLAEPVSGVELVRDALAPGLVPVTQAAVGERLAAGNVRISVLGPAAAMHGTRSDPNNSSVVLRAAVGDLTILLPGDAEVEEQDALLGAGTDVHADILKVPHHGSAYSDPAFLAATSASLGVISVGLHNDYGHPSPTLLQEMAALAVPLRRTDLDGDVAVTGDRAHLAAVVHGPTDPALQAAAQTRPALRSASRRGILIVAMLAACPASGAPTVLARAARTPCTGGIRAAVAARGRPP